MQYGHVTHEYVPSSDWAQASAHRQNCPHQVRPLAVLGSVGMTAAAAGTGMSPPSGQVWHVHY